MDKNKRIELIIAFESGELEEKETLKLFSDLIKTGMCWKLQGFYGRIAEDLIQKNIINRKGNILIK